MNRVSSLQLRLQSSGSRGFRAYDIQNLSILGLGV